MRPWWHPEEFSRRRPHLEARGRILAATRGFFAARGYTEVETAALQVSPGMEPHLRAFSTVLEGPDGAARSLHLHTSPEFAMKRLLVAGAGPIYQLARVWRNGERADTHHPEFTMLEWYRPGAAYTDLIAETRALLAAAATAGTGRLRFRGQESDPAEIEVLTVVEAFARHAGIDLDPILRADGSTDDAAMAHAADRIGVRRVAADTFEDMFFRVFLERIEPKLGSPHPTVVKDYPISMAALARAKADDPRFAERFEVYACGLELANAFGELTEAGTQRARFEADQAAKRRLYGFAYPIDDDFIAALAHGMPASAGIALGFDRMVMLASGADRIEDVLWAPVTMP
jgi:elongation factor P--(R)-beta-lysine ligase